MVNSNLPDNMLTASEVSRILHVHPNTLRRWAEKGIIKSIPSHTAATEGLCPGILIIFSVR